MRITKEHRQLLIAEVFQDKLNGYQTSDIRRKMLEVNGYSGCVDPLTDYQQDDIIREVNKQFKSNSDIDIKEAKSNMSNYLMAIYQDAMAEKDRRNALAALKQLAELQGLNNTNAIIANSNNIKVVVSFGNQDKLDKQN